MSFQLDAYEASSALEKHRLEDELKDCGQLDPLDPQTGW